MKRNRKLCSFVLILTMFVSCCSVKAYATETDALTEDAAVKFDLIEGTRASDANIVDGTYYFKNKELSDYLQIDNNDSGEDAIMELWEYDGETDQMREITNLGDGYYKIVSTSSGLALSVQSGKLDSDEKALVQETYSGLSRQKADLVLFISYTPVMYSDAFGKFVITGTTLLIAALIGAAAGATVGGIYGGITAAANNQNVVAGIFTGIFTGGLMGAGAGVASVFIAPVLFGEGIMIATASGAGFVVGNAIGAGTALAIGTSIAFGSGAVGGATSDIFTQIINNGSVTDWASVGISALQWGVLNTVGTYLSSLGGPHLTGFENFVLSQVFNHLTSSIGLLSDLIRASINKKGMARMS